MQKNQTTLPTRIHFPSLNFISSQSYDLLASTNFKNVYIGIFDTIFRFFMLENFEVERFFLSVKCINIP